MCIPWIAREFSMSEFHETIIIGGGPAGLTAGLYLKRAGIDTLLLERGTLGGTPLNTGMIENYPGFPEGVSGRELMNRFISHAKSFDLSIQEFTSIETIACSEEVFTITTSGAVYTSLGVIVASGTEPMKMNIPGEAELAGRGISYCATCDGMFFRGLDVAVIGGGDSAVEEALMLSNIAQKVYIVHRRDSLRAQKILQERAFRSNKIEFLMNKELLEIAGHNEVEHILLRDKITSEMAKVAVNGVFIYVGIKPNTSFLSGLADMDNTGFIITDEELSTKTKGLFVAGDARKKPLRQISTAVGDGALAAVSLEKYILEKKS